MKKISLFIIAIILLVAVAGGAFYWGMFYGKSQILGARGNFSATRTRTAGGNGTAGGNFITGNIISKDSSSITVQLPNNGGSKIIFYSNTTQISKFSSGTESDLSAGQSVTINGTANSDGSVTANSIQIRTAMKNSGQ